MTHSEWLESWDYHCVPLMKKLIERIESLERNQPMVCEGLDSMQERIEKLEKFDNFNNEIFADIRKRLLTIENFIGQNYVVDTDRLGERIEKLEEWMRSPIDVDMISKCEDRLERLEKHLICQREENLSISERLNELEESYQGLYHDTKHLFEENEKHKLTEFMCPNCKGTGRNQYYIEKAVRDIFLKCILCSGTGKVFA